MNCTLAEEAWTLGLQSLTVTIDCINTGPIVMILVGFYFALEMVKA